MRKLAHELKGKVYEVIGVGVAMIAVLIVAAMAIAASIQANLRSAVVSAASFFELYMLMWMIKQF